VNSNLDCNSQLFLSLWIECNVFIDPMASFQSSLSFLFEGRILKEDTMSDPIAPNVHGEAGNIVDEVFQTPITDVVANFVGSNVPKPLEHIASSQSDCVLLAHQLQYPSQSPTYKLSI
jgi:hypothetical protein